MGPGCAGGKETSLAFASATFVISKMNPGCAAEQHAWREVKDGWRPLYGDVDKIGVAIEWHDFGGASGRESSTNPLVPEQGAGAHGAFSLCAEGSGIFLYAAKTRRP